MLSINEVNKYFNSDEARRCKATDYAITNGAYVGNYNGNCWWWLRSPGEIQYGAAAVEVDGSVCESGDRVTDGVLAVRPAMWIDLNS